MCFAQESQNKLWNRLDGIGFNIKSEEIFSSLTAAHDLVKSRNLRPFLLLSDSAMEVSYLLWSLQLHLFAHLLSWLELKHKVNPWLFLVLKPQTSESWVKSSSIYLWILYGFWSKMKTNKESRVSIFELNSSQLTKSQCVELKLRWQFCVHTSTYHEIYF